MTDAPSTKQTSRRDLAKQGDAIQLIEQRVCDRCGKPFMPRTGSGGSAQRFCSADCRLSFHTERLRSQRTTTYAGQTALLATPHSATSETLTRSPAVAALHPWQSGVLDIADCQRTEFVVALKDGETASTQVETWPAEVRTFMDQHVGRWVDENKDARNVHAITVAAPNYDNIQSCVTILHHSLWTLRHASVRRLEQRTLNQRGSSLLEKRSHSSPLPPRSTGGKRACSISSIPSASSSSWP